MAERYFLILVVALTVAGSLWLSFVNPMVSYGIFLASLLALLGLAAVANSQMANKASILMPLFFIAAILYEAYLYLNGRFGYILVSIFLLSLTGLVLGFGISQRRKKTAKPAHKQAGSAPAPAPAKRPRRKSPRKGRRRGKK